MLTIAPGHHAVLVLACIIVRAWFVVLVQPAATSKAHTRQPNARSQATVIYKAEQLALEGVWPAQCALYRQGDLHVLLFWAATAARELQLLCC